MYSFIFMLKYISKAAIKSYAFYKKLWLNLEKPVSQMKFLKFIAIYLRINDCNLK